MKDGNCYLFALPKPNVSVASELLPIYVGRDAKVEVERLPKTKPVKQASEKFTYLWVVPKQEIKSSFSREILRKTK